MLGLSDGANPMRRHVSLRLPYALVILLVMLMPAMAVIAAGAGRSGSLALMLWMVLLVPLLLVPWLWRCRASEECAEGPRIAAAAAPPDDASEAKLFEAASARLGSMNVDSHYQ